MYNQISYTYSVDNLRQTEGGAAGKRIIFDLDVGEEDFVLKRREIGHEEKSAWKNTVAGISARIGTFDGNS